MLSEQHRERMSDSNPISASKGVMKSSDSSKRAFEILFAHEHNNGKTPTERSMSNALFVGEPFSTLSRLFKTS